MDKPVESVEKCRPAGFFSEGRKPVLGLFAKEPRPGEVKTRLCPPFSGTQAAAFHRLAIAETVAGMRGGSFDLVLFHTGDGSFFRRRFPDLTLRQQAEGGLGERMAAALQVLLAGGAPAAALIGSDTPDLPRSLVEKAFAALAQADAVLSPARDGGYVLVGTRRNAPGLFRAVPWSTPGVLEATRRRAAEEGVCLAEVEGWEDVDDLPALERFLVRSPASAAARFARRVFSRKGGLCAVG